LIGFGTYKLLGEEAVTAVKMALHEGYTHIDTASYYKNEESIRKAIEESGIARSKLYITSKVDDWEQGSQ
jgi:diketogulonate reductase-like aldo/keto reductase